MTEQPESRRVEQLDAEIFATQQRVQRNRAVSELTERWLAALDEIAQLRALLNQRDADSSASSPQKQRQPEQSGQSE